MASADGIKKIKEYSSFVRPVRNPILSDFCTTLTTITQVEVDSAGIFPIVFAEFLSWIGNTDNILIGSWGAYDLKQLDQDCYFHKIKNPFKDRHINLKKRFSELHDVKKFGMKGALKALGLEIEGTHHRGIDDANNIFRICQHVPEIFTALD
jgi:inhibitor of KinA sporulation pathway (predicted exonuclease)